MEEDIEKLRNILNERLDEDNGARVREQLSLCEAWSARVSYMYRNALSELYKARYNALMPKSSTMTEIDRKTRLDSDTREYQQSVDELKDLQEIIKRRISLGQTIMKSIVSEVEL